MLELRQAAQQTEVLFWRLCDTTLAKAASRLVEELPRQTAQKKSAIRRTAQAAVESRAKETTDDLIMSLKPDQLLERLAAMEADFAEFESAFPHLGLVTNQLAQIMERHKHAGTLFADRLARGKDVDAKIAELREVFRTYAPLLRSLSIQCIRVADITARIHGKLSKLNEP